MAQSAVFHNARIGKEAAAHRRPGPVRNPFREAGGEDSPRVKKFFPSPYSPGKSGR